MELFGNNQRREMVEKKKQEVGMIDCHSHLSFLETEALDRTLEKNSDIQYWIQGGYGPSDWGRQFQIKESNSSRIKTCVGLHPWFVRSNDFNKNLHLQKWKSMVDGADFVGELGLDFFGEASSLKKELQIEIFEEQLAYSADKPMVFHIVKAHGKALEILKNKDIRGFVHSFSGSIEVANEYIKQGIMLSFSPNLLNEKYKKVREVLTELPLESILVESDSPSSPGSETYDYKSFIKALEEVARIKKIGVEELSLQIEKNLKSLMEP